jgi:hypothetical protein
MPDFDCTRAVVRTGVKERIVGRTVRVPKASFIGGNGLTGYDTMRITGVSISHAGNLQCTVKCLETAATCKIWPWQLMHSGAVSLASDDPVCFAPADEGYTPSRLRNSVAARWCKSLLQPGDTALVLDGMAGGTSTTLHRYMPGLAVYSANTCQDTALVRAVAGDLPLYLPLATPGKRWPAKGVMELLGLSLDKPHMLSAEAQAACSSKALLLDMYGTWKEDFNRILRGLVEKASRSVILLTYCTRNSPFRPDIPDGYSCVYTGKRATMRWIILVPTADADAVESEEDDMRSKEDEEKRKRWIDSDEDADDDGVPNAKKVNTAKKTSETKKTQKGRRSRPPT